MKKVLRIVAILLILVMITSLINLFSWYKENNRVKKIVSTVSEYLVVEDEVYRVDEEIKEVNEDIVGWLKVDNTKIDYPVVKGTNNKYYLNHDLDKNKNSAGWIFMDYQNNIDDQNIVIYGHHRRDGSMFGDIDKLLNEEFYKNNNEIILITPEETITYQIFSVYSTSPYDIYINNNFDNFNYYLDLFKERSNIEFNDFLEKTTQILTLSTCSNNNIDRIVVHAYKKN